MNDGTPKSSGTAPRPVPLADEGIQRALTLIHGTFTHHLSLHVIAAAAGYSPFHFHRTFKATTGLTPHDVVACLRMQQAKRELAFTEATVTEIARHVGYASPPSFSSQFNRLVGFSPSAFRRMTAQAGTLATVDSIRVSTFNRGDMTFACLGDEYMRGHVAVAGLFARGLPFGNPEACAVLRVGEMGSMPVTTRHRAGTLFVIAVPPSTLVLDVVLGSPAGAVYGQVPAGSDRTGGSSPVIARLTCPAGWHPAVTSAAFAGELIHRSAPRPAGHRSQ